MEQIRTEEEKKETHEKEEEKCRKEEQVKTLSVFGCLCQVPSLRSTACCQWLGRVLVCSGPREIQKNRVDNGALSLLLFYFVALIPHRASHLHQHQQQPLFC